MLTRMSDSSSRDLREPASAEGSGILAGLPRTRPQRASARRTASREAAPETSRTAASQQPNAAPSRPAPAGKGAKASAPAKAEGKTSASGGRPKTTAEGSARTKTRARVADNDSTRERAPRQGFEAEPDSLGPVQPPGSTELISSAAELAGELAKAGVNTGARVLKDFLSRLPG
jgi:hypothetical protein